MRLRLLVTIALAVACVAASTASASRAVTVRCHASGALCHAVVSLVGGASNEHIHIVLPAHRWAHPTARPSRHELVGAYALSHGHFSGSAYFVTLSAVGSIASGELVFTFHRA